MNTKISEITEKLLQIIKDRDNFTQDELIEAVEAQVRIAYLYGKQKV